MTSPRLCGGILVASPTAMPDAPLTRRLGNLPGQRFRFFQAVVEVEGKADGILFDVAQKFERERLQPRFGITHRRGGVAVDRAEVAVPVDERHAHIEILRHAHHRVVHGRVAVRVIFTHAVADDARALFVRLVGRQPHVVHGVQDPALHGLQPVLHARQRAVENDVLRIREHGTGQHLFERGQKQTALGFFLRAGVRFRCFSFRFAIRPSR